MKYSITEVKASNLSMICTLDVNPPVQKEIHIQNEKNGFVIFYGEIFSETIPDPKKYISEVYESGDFGRLQELNGSFIAAIYDQGKEKLTLINDRFGSLKLFYYYDKKNLFFSPKIAPLMKIVEKKKIRKDALIDFLLFGFFLEDKTFDENILQLPPASVLEITASHMEIKNYWTYPCDGSYDARDKDILRDELGKRWQKAVDQRVQNKQKIIVQVSGGLDSRAILAAALKNARKENIILYTFGEEGSYDFDIGTAIAQKLGIQQAAFRPIKEKFAQQYIDSFHDTEGMIDATPYFPLQMGNTLKPLCSEIFNGYMGGEIMGPLIFAKLKNLTLKSDADYEKAKNILFEHHIINDMDTIDFLLNKSYLDGVPILSSFEKSIADLKGISIEELPNYCARWLYLNESDKYTWFCNYRSRDQFRYTSPFLDNDVVDFMIRTPPGYRTNKHLYKTMLLCKYFDLYDFPTKNNLGLPLQANPIRLYVKRVLWFFQRRINGLSNRILHHAILLNKYDNFINYDNLIRTNDEYQLFIKTMLEKLKRREFFNPTALDALWMLHLKGKKNYSRLFGLLVTLELVLEHYYDS